MKKKMERYTIKTTKKMGETRGRSGWKDYKYRNGYMERTEHTKETMKRIIRAYRGRTHKEEGIHDKKIKNIGRDKIKKEERFKIKQTKM